MATLAERLDSVRARIAAACARAGRSPDEVTLVAVSKTHPAERILEAIAAGQAHFGENRIEEAAEKIAAVNAASPTPVTWHMVGHVQSRKAHDVAATFDWVHSLDSEKLAARYARAVSENPARRGALHCLIQMNVSGEASKSGFPAWAWRQDRAMREALWETIRRLLALPGLDIAGLMTMAPIVDDAERARPVFVALRELRDALRADFPLCGWHTLSMGMTDDYDVAVEEGATLVRIGRAIFGEREMEH
ncbi:MAG: YggS family pyridoxal phosphate-dependent enzyme [Anaerolineae bacterium]|nr:YggS family pyridoxal phosphate-dependent enzyme [Anaerolineae bacterium]